MTRNIEIKRVRSGSLDFEFAELLFQLWMKGKTPQDLVDMFANTDRAFSLSTIQRISTKYKWTERRDNIVNSIIEKNNAEMQLFSEKRLSMANSIIALMEEELNDYLKDPKHNLKPRFFPKNTNDLNILFRLFEFIKNGGVDKKQIDVGLNDFGLDIDEGTATALLDVLSKISTKQVKGEVIDAEFLEEISSDEEAMKYLNDASEQSTIEAESANVGDKNKESTSED